MVKMEFGSHLYGMNTPTSDKDYKGIFIPSADEILSYRIPKTVTLSSGNGNRLKNTPADVDDELYSLPYFLELALKGETVALDMLHAESQSIIKYSLEWDVLRANRQRFYTKTLRSFVGYARKQAAKYGIKGSRLDAVREALSFAIIHANETVGEVYESLWEAEHCHKYHNGVENVWEVCGKKLMAGTKFATYVPTLKKFYENYGDRARLAAANEGIDWKAVSHALRAGYQAKDIFSKGDFTYPLAETDFLIKVKNGELNYANEVAPELDRIMDEVDALAKLSSLPEEPDYDWATDFLQKVLLNVVRRRLDGTE